MNTVYMRMSYFDSCDLLLRAAENDANHKKQRRDTEEAKLWDLVKSIMKPLGTLRTLSLNKPAKFDEASGRTSMEYVDWLNKVRETREEIGSSIRTAWASHKDLYGLPMGNSTCGKIALQMDMVITMMEHTYSQVDESFSTA